MSEDTAESQMRGQREARELAVSEAEKWHARYNEEKKAHDEHLLQSAEKAAAAEVQLAQLRADLRMASFESERLSLQCEQNLAGSRKGELESDSWREKLEVRLFARGGC